MNCTTYYGSCGPPLWYLIPECATAPYGFIFYYAVKVLNLAVGTPSNVLVMWHIANKKSDASTSDIFIFNLATLDAYFCLMTPVDMVNRILLYDSGIWYIQRFAYGVKDLAPLFLVCICLDRYMAVVHPIIFTNIRDNKLRIGVLVVVWGFILAYGLAKSILGVMSLNNIFSGVILFSFGIMVFCNISIIWALSRSVIGKEAMHPVKKKALKMVMIILVIIVANYLPPLALMPFSSYFSFKVYKCHISVTVYSFMDLSSSIEPLVYMTKIEFVDSRCCVWGLSKKPHDASV